MTSKSKYCLVFAGGGTGGHLYPAVAVAERIQNSFNETEIHFIGTKNKLEGKVIPKLGFHFHSIWIQGFSRTFNLNNILFPLKLIVSIIQSILINIKVKPQVAIGSGGYAAGPAIYAAYLIGAKIILLEQNSLPGITTRILQKYADEIHITYEETIKYLKKKENVFLTGNPVRNSLELIDKEIAKNKLNLKTDKKVVLILGGSLGARSINEAVKVNLKKFSDANIQLLWQCGKNYFDIYKNFNSTDVKVMDFIEDMQLVYSASDLVVSRAGATTIAELSILGKVSILIPSPNVAANHQYYNAKTLVDKEGAVLIDDQNASEKLFETVQSVINDNMRMKILSNNIKSFSNAKAAEIIAARVIQLAEEKNV